MINSILTHLGSCHRRIASEKYSILDCVFQEATSTFCVLDVMCWKVRVPCLMPCGVNKVIRGIYYTIVRQSLECIGYEASLSSVTLVRSPEEMSFDFWYEFEFW